MKKNNKISDKNERMDNLNELKIELLKQMQKRKAIKKEIARILTYTNQDKLKIKEKK
jgi:ribosomal protein L29